MGTITVIDDEEQILSIFKELGENELNHKVKTFTDGKLALEYLQSNKCDLIISDYRMAGISGVKIYKNIRESGPNLETLFVFLSAYPDEIRREVGTPPDIILRDKPIFIPSLLKFLKKHLA